MKKILKGILLISIICISLILTISPAFAVSDPKTYDGKGSTIEVKGIETFGQNIVSLISTVGSVVSVIVLIVLGIKYMMGSAEEKAEYKKTLLPYIIGAALVFAASSIASIIFSFAKDGFGV